MFCPKCGKQILDDSVFCAFCGHRFGDGVTAQAAPNVQIQPRQSFQQPYQQYQQPFPQVPAQAQPAFGQTTPAEKKSVNPVVIFLVTLLIGGLVIAAVALFYNPGYLVNRDDDDGGKKKKKSDSSVSMVDDSSVKDTTSTETETAPPETTVEETTPAETTTAETTTPETTAPPETTKSEAELKAEENGIAKEEAEKYSTRERPDYDEFEWCYGQFGLIRDMPEGAEPLTNPYSWAGGWKCLMVYDSESSEFSRELSNVDIGIYGEDSAALIVDWYYMEFNGDGVNEETMEDTSFYGSIVDGQLQVIGSGRITMEHFWKENNAEYAVGDFMLPDGTSVYIAMTRRRNP